VSTPSPASSSAATTRDTPILAAGAVVWRPGNPSGIQLALVHRPRYDDWSLPKGKLDSDEHPLVAARREVLEETGHLVVLGRPLGVQRYQAADHSGTLRPKHVHYWLARATSGAHTPDSEVDELVWVDPSAARARLSYPRDVALVDRALDGPLDTVTVVVLRHAKATSRRRWRDGDAIRPLSPDGVRQAERLAGMLAAYGRLVPVSSPTARSTGTLRPYAEATGQALLIDDRYDEQHAGTGAPADALSELLARLRATPTGTGNPTGTGSPPDGVVICTHGPDLPELASALAVHDPDPTQVPRQLRKGEMAVAHLARATGRLVAVERHRP